MSFPRGPDFTIVLLILLVAMLSGCLQIIDEQADPAVVESVEPAPGLGSITGKVVTDDLVQVEGARVAVLEESAVIKEGRTDGQGQYVVKDIPPGDYRVVVFSPCCRNETVSVDLTGDEVRQVNIRLAPLSKDERQVGYVVRNEWTGFLACTVRWVDSYGLAPSGINACGLTDALVGNVTDDDFLLRWTARPGLETVVGGLTWSSPGAALADELALYMEVSGRPGDPPRYADVAGESPLEWRVDAGDVERQFDPEFHSFDFNNLQEPLELMYRVFAEGDVNVVYQQEFTVYWDLYFWEPAPPGVSALPDL